MRKIRCPYFELNDRERAYHDKEWGTPCRNDRKLFEYLMYEVLQCGLSWDTILSKREAFLVAFEGCNARNLFALWIMASTFRRERIIPGTARTRLMLRSP